MIKYLKHRYRRHHHSTRVPECVHKQPSTTFRASTVNKRKTFFSRTIFFLLCRRRLLVPTVYACLLVPSVEGESSSYVREKQNQFLQQVLLLLSLFFRTEDESGVGARKRCGTVIITTRELEFSSSSPPLRVSGDGKFHSLSHSALHKVCRALIYRKNWLFTHSHFFRLSSTLWLFVVCHRSFLRRSRVNSTTRWNISQKIVISPRRHRRRPVDCGAAEKKFPSSSELVDSLSFTLTLELVLGI